MRINYRIERRSEGGRKTFNNHVSGSELVINFFSLVPNSSKIKINTALITMKRLEFVKDKFIPEISISGPIL